MKKRIISLLLSLVLCLSLVSVAFATESEDDTLKEGTQVVTIGGSDVIVTVVDGEITDPTLRDLWNKEHPQKPPVIKPDDPTKPDVPGNYPVVPDTPVKPDDPNTPVVPDEPDEPITLAPGLGVSNTGGTVTPVKSYDVTNGNGSNDNGSWSVDKTSAKAGETVTITANPNEGFKTDAVTVTDANGNEIRVNSLGDDRYSFTMPANGVTVNVTFAEGESGEPTEPTEPANTPANPFTDVNTGDYFYDAVLWAVEQGITNGTSADKFSPNQTCTRAQTVTFLWRAAGSPAPTGTANPFTDVNAGDYFYNAVLWAVEQGITNGTSADKFSPNATVTRGQTVTFMYRAAGSPAASGNNPFTDVNAGDYFYNAVLWAVGQSITNGTTATTFGPADGCTRGQIVTFLYRAK